MADADFTLAEDDTGPYIKSQLLDENGEKIPLGGALSVIFRFSPADGSGPRVDGAAEVFDEDESIVIYRWGDTDAAIPRRMKARWKLTLANGQRISVPNDRKLDVVIDDDP